MSHLLQGLGLLNPLDVLRAACGLWFIPHLIGKFTGRQSALDFFDKIGFRPPQMWLYAAIAIETVVMLGLVFDVQTRAAALLGASFLVVAAYGLYQFTDGDQPTKLGMTRYPLLWAICCGVIAMAG
jgi:putative oxidoreductase